tara:strand:- start:238 stop:429 length:192 start_codon:yes stop_codon:yes gene_type:complete
LRDALKDEFPDSIFKMIKSGGGVFEIYVNDNLEVFSKKRTGRFPETYEVLKTIRDAIIERRVG